MPPSLVRKPKKFLSKKLEKPSKVLEHVGKDEKFLKDKEKDKQKKKEKDNKTKEGKASKKDEKGKGKESKVIKSDRRPRRNKDKNRKSYAYYIHKVLKTVHPHGQNSGKKCNLSIKAMSILDCLAIDLYGRLTNEAILLTKRQKKRTLSSIEVQTATRLVLPGELAKHAMGDGTKAVLNFQQRDEGV